MPNGQDSHVSGESTRLQNERRLDQDLPSQLFASAGISISRFGCAVTYHQLDQEVDSNECC
jgi:hypothetical protein